MKELIFIIEDDLTQQKILQHHFEEGLGNYIVKCFEDPEDMVEHLKDKPFAIVLDHYFSSKAKTGLDYLTLLKKKHSSIPIIYYTSINDPSIRESALKGGAEQFILKDGASLVRLRTALDSIVAKKNKKSFFSWLKN